MAMVIQDLDAQLAACYDVIGILIMTRIVAHCQLQMTHAQVPVLTGFLDRLGLMLWPHFSRLIREHIDSITLGALHVWPCKHLSGPVAARALALMKGTAQR